MIGTTIIVEFQSAISRYLVSNDDVKAIDMADHAVSIRYVAVLGFQLDLKGFKEVLVNRKVSIRYVAVLGFQPYLKNTPSDQRRRKRFTHPPVE